ncbi:hypothetical protein CYMTET_11375 [Cymbomonas tetramitiformis]|uniref:Uncharacterized protein n=1 Tax=Cymbomonas tetramitiformis TaxID=36881 RepID=A0AAE0LDJ2_9CHLO|nr:hypothetical protein CYMTET_11375 [Cymbomonas tetramitiformis]
MLQTVARFDTNGYFGTLYVLIKDKCDVMSLYRPIQPNYTCPTACVQNRLGRAADFIVDALGGSFTLGGTHRLQGRLADFNARAAASAYRVFGATFDVKDQFSNVDHCLGARAVMVETPAPSGSPPRQVGSRISRTIRTGLLVRQTRGVGMGGRDSPSMAGLVCAYGEHEFSESLRADADFINLMSFVRQADDCMVLIIVITGSSQE